ncbi:hypothetical protein BBO99_00008575 [Phytophthora kernoviae]|uniref:Myb-like DNA-binding protein n=2 Tax=Phytophthora kernoviae TaxID=325452 RepID=A0A3R7JVW6_9STRA|nr:hypothetical protein G195_008553 [Phytophthora kernoviae 00238/432]KAG2510934.1 hypothetical protein JM16_008337 [Phytophthora kernoviae]KAG2514613.1 hypothetical protein JM18_008283 [Phytophthora kernoviae]RLN25854.1 hypothetical protein BBI17_008579 [Phytophthora kernoviae]RLN75052.1 hypothetical protein BBO99_00008575 [Phytophthora kernoviae]
MSISVSRESISKLMGELVETFPMEAEGRSSISDFGKLLFTEGQASTAVPGVSKPNNGGTIASKPASSNSSNGAQTQTGSKRVFTEIKGVPRQKQHDIMKTKDKAVPKRWTQEEDDKLREAVGRHGERNWKSIAEEVPGRNHTQCLQRWTKVLAPGLVKGHWRPDEDDLLKELVAEGRKNWGQVATRIPGRTSKQCRERWYNHLDPSIVRGEYTPEEDRMILDAQARLGNRWSAIAAMLPGRTEDAVKIRWKSLCRVRKGQGRRGQVDKNKMTSKGVMGMPGQMMQQGQGFDNGMVKSEEVGAFSMHPQQQGPQMMRLANGQMVPAASMQGGGQHHQAMSMMGGMGAQGMMYPSDMSGGGYDPTMAHYRKPPMQQHVSNGYGHSLPPTAPIQGNNAQDFVDRRNNMMQQSVPVHEREQPNPEKEPPSPQQQDEHTSADRVVKGESRTQAMPNPAAMFARSQSAKPSPGAVNSNPVPAVNSNPVAAFIQQQQQQKRKGQPSGASRQFQGPPKPFNPAAVFAQRFQAMQKPPPMPSSSGASSTKSNDDDEDGGNASGDRTNEPSLKKVKPRLSIDAARASAARRLRNSGNGGNLAGRGSLDVFLNEIGDVGRLSDLKMDEFQTLDELWRVSGDMDRLSL